MTRPRHRRPELEEVLKRAEKKGWRVEHGKRYWMLWCPCGKHHKTVKKTPSGGNYKQNLLGQLGRATCWNNEEPQP